MLGYINEKLIFRQCQLLYSTDIDLIGGEKTVNMFYSIFLNKSASNDFPKIKTKNHNYIVLFFN